MQMVIQRNPHQPVKITLRGNLSEEDAQILKQECFQLVQHTHPCQVWIYLENMSQSSDQELLVFHQIFMLFQQARFQMTLITPKKALYKRFLERGLPAQHYAPNPILHQAIVY